MRTPLFDNLPFIEPTPSQPTRWRAPSGLVLGLATILLAWNTAAPKSDAIITSADHLQQIEVLSSTPTTMFYLCNAGFHSRRQRHLIATLYGAQNWSVTWQGPHAATISPGKPHVKIVTQNQPDFHLTLHPS